MRTRKEKPIFRGLTIAAHGPLGGSEQWTDTNITRWVTLREGRFVRIGGEAAGGAAEKGKGKGNGEGKENGNGKGDGKGGGEGVLGEEVTHVVCSKQVFWGGGRVGKSFFLSPFFFLSGLCSFFLGGLTFPVGLCSQGGAQARQDVRDCHAGLAGGLDARAAAAARGELLAPARAQAQAGAREEAGDGCQGAGEGCQGGEPE